MTSFADVQRIYRAARKAVGCMRGTGGNNATEQLSARSRWRRKVRAEFDRRLKAAGIQVEGLR